MARRTRSNADEPIPQPTTDPAMAATQDLPVMSPGAATPPFGEAPPEGAGEVTTEPERRPTRSRGAGLPKHREASRTAMKGSRKRGAGEGRTHKQKQGAGAQRKAPQKSDAGKVSALEESAKKPSRKSTRTSTNRAKSAETKYPTKTMKSRSPKVRATRAIAGAKRSRGKGGAMPRGRR